MKRILISVFIALSMHIALGQGTTKVKQTRTTKVKEPIKKPTDGTIWILGPIITKNDATTKISKVLQEPRPSNDIKLLKTPTRTSKSSFGFTSIKSINYKSDQIGIVIKEHFGVSRNSTDFRSIENFYNEFLNKFADLNEATWQNRLFLTTHRAGSGDYLGFFKVDKGIPIVEFQKVNSGIIQDFFIKNKIEERFSGVGENGVVYVHVDKLFGIDKWISETASKYNLLLINQNTSFKKTFDQTEKTIRNLENKRLEKSSLSFFNGIPQSIDEVKFQKFDEADIENFKNAKSEIDNKATLQTTKTITSKKDLIDEITTGKNNLLIIVAHSDGENMYFQNEKISIKELKNLVPRTDDNQARVAILFSCLTGNILEKKKPFFSFWGNNLQSFSEIMLEKNFFNFIISPSEKIKVGEVLKMMNDLDKYDILDLWKVFNEHLDNGQMNNIAKLFINEKIILH